MARIDSPSALMYTRLKSWGLSNHDAATVLLNTALTFDGKMLRDRIEDSSQLSRRIVHTRPGELSLGLFNSFQISCPRLVRAIVERLAATRRISREGEAQELLYAELVGSGASQMMGQLRDMGIDESPYRNMLGYLERAILPREEDRLVLQLMLFVVTGCSGNPRTASTITIDYATNVLGADFHTAQTVVSAAKESDPIPQDLLLGLVRIVDGRIEAGSQMHVLSPEGTEIGLLPEGKHVVSDVGDDVSRRHAFVWREGGHWLVRDLGSTNGTSVVSGADGMEREVGVDPAELLASDVICLGGSTRYIVMPVLAM